jgi:hypothetical protein
MANSIPEYYRHLADKRRQDAASDEASSPQEDPDEAASPKSAPEGEPVPYRADAFRMMLPSGDWEDRSVYTLTGPTIDGIQHNITVHIEDEPDGESVYDFAGQEIALLEPQLDNCRILTDDPVNLMCGHPAYRAIYTWMPEDDLKLYQEQVYVLANGVGYVLTASFTRKTRKQLGARVEQMMLSFTPSLFDLSR